MIGDSEEADGGAARWAARSSSSPRCPPPNDRTHFSGLCASTTSFDVLRRRPHRPRTLYGWPYTCSTPRPVPSGVRSRPRADRRRSTCAAPPCRARRTSGTCASGAELRRPAPLAGATAATTSRSSATSPTSTTRSSPRRPRPAGRGGRGRPRTSARSTTAYDALGCLPPTVEPRATGHVTEMIELMQRLIDGGPRLRGRAATSTSTCAPSPATARCPASGSTRCSRARPDGARQARPARLRAVEGRQAGRAVVADAVGTRAGRAGTSSARRWPTKYLGPEFDIHGGGLDLVFPHHENELAQSQRGRRRVRPVLDAQRAG